jgi:hypothetical protein
MLPYQLLLLWPPWLQLSRLLWTPWLQLSRLLLQPL